MLTFTQRKMELMIKYHFRSSAAIFLCILGNILFLGGTAFAQKVPDYDNSVPQPTLLNVSYGEHKRHVLDFWKAESDTSTPCVYIVPQLRELKPHWIRCK